MAEAYNTSQSKVHVSMIEASYQQTIDKYLQSSQANRPDLVQMPEYMVQTMVDTGSTVPVEACLKSSGYDTTAFLPTLLEAFATQGVDWSMPFNISIRCCSTTRRCSTAAGLDPENPPASLDDIRADSQKLVDSGPQRTASPLDAASTRAAGGTSSSGSPRPASSTPTTRTVAPPGRRRCCTTTTPGVDAADPAAGAVDRRSGRQRRRQHQRTRQPVQAGRDKDAGGDDHRHLGVVGPVINGRSTVDSSRRSVVDGPGDRPDARAAASPGRSSAARRCGIVVRQGRAQTAAAWDFIKYLTRPRRRARGRGHRLPPVRTDAADPGAAQPTWPTDPRFTVSLDQLNVGTPKLRRPSARSRPDARGPVIAHSSPTPCSPAIFGGADVELRRSATRPRKPNALIADYNAPQRVAGAEVPLAEPSPWLPPFPPSTDPRPSTAEFYSLARDGHRPVEALHRHDRHPMGTIVIALDAVNAPKTVNNFVFLAAAPLLRRRDLPPHHQRLHVPGRRPARAPARGGPGYKFEDEPVKQRYQIGSVAMANAGPNTNGSQFFLISGPSGVGLPPQYNHFGQIVKGLDVLDAMQRVPTDRGDRAARRRRDQLGHHHRRRLTRTVSRAERPHLAAAGAAHRARRAGLRRPAPDRPGRPPAPAPGVRPDRV